MKSSKNFCLFLFAFFIITSLGMSQEREFIVGSLIGFYGIHQMDEINSLYSNTGGTVGGTGDFSVGLNVRRAISEKAFLGFELRYIRKGSIYGFISSYNTQAYESIRLSYIEIPILLGYKIPIKSKYLITETGLAYARLISSKMEINELNPWDFSNNLDNFRNDEISWITNLKYPIIKSNKLLAGFRFSYSIASVHSQYSIYNMNYGIELYYLFNRNVN